MAKRAPHLAPKRQVAALPLRLSERDGVEVLLVTSRETQRWIIPKGWPMAGMTEAQAAAREALEEAGLVGRVHRKPIGTYSAWKRVDAAFLQVEVRVFRLDVERQRKVWREKGQRRLCWVPLAAAAELVDEPGLSALLLDMAGEPSDAEA